MNSSAITALRVLRQVLVELPVAENLMCWLRAPGCEGFAWESEHNPKLLGTNVYNPSAFDKDWRTMLIKFDLSPIEDWKGWLKQVLVKHELMNNSSDEGGKTPSRLLKVMAFSSGKAELKNRIRPELDDDSLPGSTSSVSIAGLALAAAMLIEPVTVLVRMDCGAGRGLVATVFDPPDSSTTRDHVVDHLLEQGMKASETQDMWQNEVNHKSPFAMVMDSNQHRGYYSDMVARNIGNLSFRLVEMVNAIVENNLHDGDWLELVEQLKGGEYAPMREASIRSCMETWESKGVPAWELMKIDV